MAAWGVATLVLLFSVLLLGYQLYQRRAAAEAPALAPGFAQSAPSDVGVAISEEEALLQLYFGSTNTSGLRPEKRLIKLPGDTVGNCKAAFAALAAGPSDDGIPVLATTARIRAMYLMSNGDLVVDFSRDVDVPGLQSVSAELLMVRSLALTLTQPGLHGGDGPPVKRVHFLFEGAPTGGHFPEHIKLDFPIEPQSSWVIPSESEGGNV